MKHYEHNIPKKPGRKVTFLLWAAVIFMLVICFVVLPALIELAWSISTPVTKIIP